MLKNFVMKIINGINPEKEIIIPIIVSLVASLIFWYFINYRSDKMKKNKLRPKVDERICIIYFKLFKYFDLIFRATENSPSMFQEVTNKNADVAFEDYPVIGYKLSLDKEPTLKMVGDKMEKNYYGFAVNKGKNQDLLKKFNDGLKKIKDSGEYDKIVNKYIKK